MLADKLRAATAKAIVAEEGGITLSAADTYSIVVPSGVTSIAALAIGGGGGGGGAASTATASGAGGGGGALSYSNTISVTPGETLTVVVGTGGSNGTTSGGNGGNGGDSYIRRDTTDLLLAKGGGGGSGNTAGSTGGAGAGGDAASGIGDTKYSGGAGGSRASNDRGGGGGGAAGYSGNGGAGASGSGSATAGSGGGGGGGYTGYDGSALTASGGSGGGTEIYGAGASGAAGVSSTAAATRNGGLGSSQGATTNLRWPGGGGGGGSSDTTGQAGTNGSGGIVRILWEGSKAFPSTGVTANSVTLFASSNSSAATITVPAGVQVGDLLVLCDTGLNTSGTPSLVTPSGFTSLGDANGQNMRVAMSYRTVLGAAEAGTTLTGISGTISQNKILLVFRGPSGFCQNASGFGVQNGYFSCSNGSITSINQGTTSQDMYASGITIAVASFYGSSGITTGTDLTFTGATYVAGVSNVFWVGYKIYTQADTDTQQAVAMTDRGTNNIGYFHVKGF